MIRLLALWTVFILSINTALTQSRTLSGKVVDAESNESLPFATIAFKNSAIGTVANGKGDFELKVPDQMVDGEIEISYLGYASVSQPVRDMGPNSVIRLTPAIVRLNELVIRPLSPQDYIRRVVRNFPDAYASDPFGSIAYYREKFMENNHYLGMTEGVFRSYYPRYQDTLTNQHQLVLYREAENPREIQFMQETFEKKEAKEKRKAQRRGEEYEEDEDGNLLHDTFGGPEEILKMDVAKDLEPFLDSTYFHKFRYSFGEPVMYQDRELLVILFESRGKVEHIKRKGTLYIDLKTDAIVSFSYKGEAIIPLAVDPLLLVFGITLPNPVFTKELRYRLLDGKWYPEYFHIHADVRISKIHFFDPNEKSHFQFEQLFNVTEVNPANAEEIPEERRFDPDKPLAEQAYNDRNLSWDEINAVSAELVN